MALNSTVLGTAIANAVAALDENDKQSLPTIWQTIADEVVLHIQTNGVVTVASGIPVTTSGGSGATTGTGTGTIA